MYSYIKGELADITEQTIVVEAGGIGYNITVPMPTLDTYFEIGQQVKIYTYLQVREDAMKLFGFMTKEDEKLFELLISVNGIGPKGAISILSTMTTDELRFAVLSGDDKSISKAPGIGAKTAQRVILELKDKFHIEETFHGFTPESGAKRGSLTTSETNSTRSEVTEALIALGFGQQEVLRVVKSLDFSAELSEEEYIKQAFSLLV